MLRLARTAALVCCDREIGGMAERPVRAESGEVSGGVMVSLVEGPTEPSTDL